MRKTIFALTLSAASIALGFTLAGAGNTPAAAQTTGADVVGEATDALTQVQDASPEPETSPRESDGNAEGDADGRRDHNCPDRDGDGRPDDPQRGAETSAEQA